MLQNNLDIDEVKEYAQNKHSHERNEQILTTNPERHDRLGIITADIQRYLANLKPEKKRKLEAVHKRFM